MWHYISIMIEQGLYKCDSDNASCPRTSTILQLLNASDKLRAAKLNSREFIQAPEDLSRAEEIAPYQNDEERITPLVCPFAHDCLRAVRDLNKDMMAGRMNVTGLGRTLGIGQP
jgi:hypothetical protein